MRLLLLFVCAIATTSAQERFDRILASLEGAWAGTARYEATGQAPVIVSEQDLCSFAGEGREVHIRAEVALSGQIQVASWVYRDLKGDGTFTALFTDATKTVTEFDGRVSADGRRFELVSRNQPGMQSWIEITLDGGLLFLKTTVKSPAGELLMKGEGKFENAKKG
jgi:hypothetical protein